MIKITLNDLLNSDESLSALLNLKLRAVNRSKLKRIISAVKPEIELFHETRNCKIKEWGTDSDGKLTIEKDNPKYNDFLNEMNEMVKQEIELNIEKLDISVLEDQPLETRHELNLHWLLTG